jgi:Carboxypeptidase regulatory-like domain
MRRKTRFALVAMIISVTALLSAQEITGDIRGVVKDPTGARVAGAKVSVTNTDRNVAIRTITTGPDGSYVAPNLPVGHYQVAVEAQGFKKLLVNDIVLNVNDHRIVDAQLQVGGTDQIVNVQESPVAVDLETAQAAGLINGTQIRELSVLSRNFIQLVTLQPGVSSDMATDQLYVGASNPTGLSNQINLSINGSRPSQNSFLIDGADDMQRGADLLLLAYPSIDSIAEFKVTRSDFLPEHGRTSSGEISIITRGGTNSLHGSAYEFFRNDKLNANNYFNNLAGVPRPPMRWNDWGFTIGGPIQKNETFFFYSQEWRHLITYTNFTSGELPSPAEMQGTFATPVCTAFSASGNCTTMGTSITNIDPTAAAYIKDIYGKLPTANVADTLVSTNRNRYYYREEAVRVDHNFGRKISVFGRYSDDSIPTTEPGGLFTGVPLPGVATTQSNSPAHILATHVTATLSNSLINDAGYTYSWGAITSTPTGTMALANSPDIKPTLPFATNAGTVPFLSFDFVQNLSGFGPYHVYNTNHSAFDTMSKIAGSHSLKFGGIFNHFNLNEDSTNNPSFYIDSLANCNASSPAGCLLVDNTVEQNWANFLLGRVNTFTEAQYPIHYLISQNEFEFFGQDEWRIRPNLTLNVGLRYSLFLSPTSPNHLLSTFNPNLYSASPAAAIQNGIGANAGYYVNPVDASKLPGLIQAGVNSPYGDSLAPTQKKDFAPRFGFAWDPWSNGKTSIRGGYGIFYGTNSVDNHEYSQATNPTFSPQNAFYLQTNLTTPTGPPAGPNTTLTPPYIYGPNPLAWKPPYTQQFNLDFQRQITPTTVLDIGYYGNLGRNLMGVVDVNMPRPLTFQSIPGYCGNYAPAPCYFRALDYQMLNQVRPYQGYDAINLFSSVYTSSYNGLEAQFQKQFTDNSQIVVNYTWSHDLTDASENFRGAQNTYNLKGDWGNSVFDRRHVFSASYVYFLPFYKGQHGLAGHVLGGWELSGVVYATSGRHYDPSVSSCREDFAGLGLCGNTWAGDRPDQVADPNSGGANTVQQWFNTGAFVIPGCTTASPKCHPTDPPLRPGDAHRGTIVGPADKRWDASIFKNTKISERINTQFRAEFFNVLNTVNFAQGAPVTGMSTTLTSSLFGRILNARDPRNIQLGLKVTF